MVNAEFFTEYERICRMWDVEELKNLMSRRSIYLLNEMRAQELDELWVREKAHQQTASFGRTWGYYVGMDAIRDYYVTGHRRSRMSELDKYCASDPSIENTEENLGVGSMYYHPVCTPVIQVAIDGKTAKGVWFSFAQETKLQPDLSVEGFWTTERIAVDFTKESGAWKIWHIMIASDCFMPVGTYFGEHPVFPEPGTDPIENEFGVPTLPMLTHNQHLLWEEDYPPLPMEPYFTYSDQSSYGPEGHPNYSKEM